MIWFAFLMIVGSMSHSLTRMSSKYDLIRLRSYFALLKPNTGETLQWRSRVSGRSTNSFFYNCKNWVEAQVSLSQSSWLMSNLAFSRWIWRRVRFSKMLPSLVFIVVLISGNKFFIFVLFWESNFSRAPIKDAARWRRSESQRESGSFTRFEEIDTDIGTCFLSKMFLSWRFPLGHKLIQSRLLLKFSRVFVHSWTFYRNSPDCQSEFLGFDIRSSDRHFFTRWLYVVKLNVPLKKVSQLGQRKDWKTALMLFT